MWLNGVKAVGKFVKALRQQEGWSQGVLAKKSGLARNTIANIEIGRRALSLDQLIQLAKALKFEPAVLLDIYRFPRETADLRTHYQNQVEGLTNDKLRVLSKFLKMRNENLQNTEQILDLLLVRDSFTKPK